MVDEYIQVLVPIIRTQAAAPLTDIGDSLVAFVGGYGRVVALVEMPGRDVDDVQRIIAGRRRELLQWISATDSRRRGPRRARSPIEIRVTHDVADGIEEAAYEQGCDLLVVEWPGLTARRPRLLGRVIDRLTSEPPADLVFVRPDPLRRETELDISRILVPIRGGPNARLALLVAGSLSANRMAKVTVLHVYQPSLTAKQRDRERSDLFDTLNSTGVRVAYELEEVTSRDTAAVILERAGVHDVVVMGAYAQSARSSKLVRRSLVNAVRALPRTVIVVRSTRGSGPGISRRRGTTTQFV